MICFKDILLAKLPDSHLCINYEIRICNQQLHMKTLWVAHSNFLVFPPAHFVSLKVAINPLASYYSLHRLYADHFRKVLKKIPSFKTFSWSFWQNNLHSNTYFYTVSFAHFLLQHCFLSSLLALFEHCIHFNFMHLNYSILSAVTLEIKVL